MVTQYPGPRDGADSTPSRGRAQDTEIIPPVRLPRPEQAPPQRRPWADRRDIAATAFYASLTILVSLLTVLLAAGVWRFLQSMGVL